MTRATSPMRSPPFSQSSQLVAAALGAHDHYQLRRFRIVARRAPLRDRPVRDDSAWTEGRASRRGDSRSRVQPRGGARQAPELSTNLVTSVPVRSGLGRIPRPASPTTAVTGAWIDRALQHSPGRRRTMRWQRIALARTILDRLPPPGRSDAHEFEASPGVSGERPAKPA